MTEEYEKGYKQGREDAGKDVRTAAIMLGVFATGQIEFLVSSAENSIDK